MKNILLRIPAGFSKWGDKSPLFIFYFVTINHFSNRRMSYHKTPELWWFCGLIKMDSDYLPISFWVAEHSASLYTHTHASRSVLSTSKRKQKFFSLPTKFNKTYRIQNSQTTVLSIPILESVLNTDLSRSLRCNDFCCRKWTWLLNFKSSTRLVKDLFENVNIDDILSFLKEIKLYQKNECKHQYLTK